MFGMRTIVVGSTMRNSIVAAAVTAAKKQDSDKIDHTTIIRVHEWAWLGDWIKDVLSIREAMDNDPDATFERLTAEFPELGYGGRPSIAGAEWPEHFFLDLGSALGSDHISRSSCAYAASHSLVFEDEDELGIVYGVIMTEATYAKKNSGIMLQQLDEAQVSIFDGNIRFQIRVFVVKDDGSVEMHKL